MSKNASKTLVEQKVAVSMFLDSLLRETENVPDEDEPLLKLAEQPAPVVAPPKIELPTPVVEPEVVEEIAIETSVEVEPEIAVAPESVKPVWADQPFQILLFNVAGLTLAVPLIELSGVVEWKKETPEMPGHSDFYIGLMRHQDQSVPVIDTARIVFPPERLKDLVCDAPRERVRKIVLIDNGAYGLACDEVSEVITIKPDQIKWRSTRSKRAWLAGTVIDHMCALLDAPALAKQIARGDR